MTLTKRLTKGSPLTVKEHDDNLDHLSNGENIRTAITKGGDYVIPTKGDLHKIARSNSETALGGVEFGNMVVVSKTSYDAMESRDAGTVYLFQEGGFALGDNVYSVAPPAKDKTIAFVDELGNEITIHDTSTEKLRVGAPEGLPIELSTVALQLYRNDAIVGTISNAMWAGGKAFEISGIEPGSLSGRLISTTSMSTQNIEVIRSIKMLSVVAVRDIANPEKIRFYYTSPAPEGYSVEIGAGPSTTGYPNPDHRRKIELNLQYLTGNDFPDTTRIWVYLIKDSDQTVADYYLHSTVPALGEEVTPEPDPIPDPVVEADYVVSSSSELSEVLANTDSTLSGKTIELQNDDVIDVVALSGRAFSPALTIRGDGVAPRIVDHWSLNGVDGLTIGRGVKTQPQGWPAKTALFELGTNLSRNIRLDRGSEYCHGYGPNLVPLDPAADYPEYERTDNFLTATTSSSAHKLTYKYDPSVVTGGFIDFFNNGSRTVYLRLGGSDVTVNASNGRKCDPGQRERFGFDSSEDTHIALIADGGDSDVNCRTEQGLELFLASMFNSSQGIDGFSAIGTHVHDIANAFKGGRFYRGDTIIDDNLIERPYMDIISMSDEYFRSNSFIQITRNIFGRPLARSGINQDQRGDAMDPHGDLIQIFNIGGTSEPGVSRVIAGNVTIDPGVREDVGTQGLFGQARELENTVLVGNIFGIGARNALCAFNSKNVYAYGCDVYDPQHRRVSTTRIDPLAGYHSYLGGILTGDVSARENTGAQLKENIFTHGSEQVQLNALYADYAGLQVAATREDALIAATAIGDAEGHGGSAAIALAIDLETESSDIYDIVDWSVIPPGLDWDPVVNVEPGETVELGPKIYLNFGTNTVTPQPGVQLKVLAKDGISVVHDWTSNPVTVEYLQFVDMKVTASTEGLTAVAAAADFGSYRISTDVKTRASSTSGVDLVGMYSNEVGKGQPRTIPLNELVRGLSNSPRENDLVLVALATYDRVQRDPRVYSNGWTPVTDPIGQDNGSNRVTLQVFGKVMGATPDESIEVEVFNGSTGGSTVQVRVYDSVPPDVLSRLIVETATSRDNIPVDPPEILPTASNSKIVAFGALAHSDSTSFVALNTDELQSFFGQGEPASNAYDGSLYAGDLIWNGTGAVDLAPWSGTPASFYNWSSIVLAIPPA